MANKAPSATQVAYHQKFLDPRWQKKRLEVLSRDQWTCQQCGDRTSTLNVHHCHYRRKKDPWEYPLAMLITLCDSCHERETRMRPLNEKALLGALREAQCLFAEVILLAAGFQEWQTWNLSTRERYLMVAALAELISDKERLQAYAARFHEEIRQQLHTSTGDEWEKRWQQRVQNTTMQVD